MKRYDFRWLAVALGKPSKQGRISVTQLNDDNAYAKAEASIKREWNLHNYEIILSEVE